MNQLEIIENDLKQLQAEVKKKHTTLRESLNSAVIAFLNHKNNQNRPNAPNFPIDEIMKAMDMIPATKSEKPIVQALNMFKNLLNYGYLQDKHLLSVLNFLGSSIEIPEDNIQVKLLQTVLLFVTPKHLDFNKFELIEKLFNLTLQMYNSKNIIIHNTASAALFQLSNIIFEKFALYIKATKLQDTAAAQQEEEKIELNQFFYQKCIKLLREFIMITNGLKPEWTPQNTVIPRNTGLDIINSVLKQVGPTLKYSKEAHQLIKKDLIPILSSCFEQKSNDFQALVRIGRATSRIILSLDDGLELVDSLVSLLNHSDVDYEKYLCVETLAMISSSPDVMKMLNERHMSTISYFLEICNSLLKLCKEVGEDPDLERKRYVPLNPKLQKILDSNLTEYEIPIITKAHLYKSLTDFFTTSIEAFVYLSERCDFRLGTTENTATKHEQKNFVDWLNQDWKPVLKCLKLLLPRQIDESMTQYLLNTFQKMISLTGSLGLKQARDSYIIALCQSCLPPDDHSLRELTLKNIQATKTVFNIAHCLGGILDINSWHSIFLTLQKTEILFDRIRNQITPHPSPTANRLSLSKTEQDKDAIKRLINQEDENSLALDLQILSAALDSLFSQSLHYPIEHLKCFLEALNQLSLEYMEKVTTSETLVIEGVAIEGKAKIFGLSRMLETILVNLDRIELFWDSILAHYVCIATNAKNVILRNRGVENLNTLTEKAFQYFVQKKPRVAPSPTTQPEETESGEGALREEENRKKKMYEMWSSENWQRTLFQPWLEISKTKFHDVKENICLALLKLLQNNGHEIDQDGWSVIASILLELSQDSMGSAINIGFKCLEMIINDYLQEIGLASVTILINVTENFKKISSDNNMSYQSVGMFWKIGDYLAKIHDREQKKGKEEGMEGFEELWMLILNRLTSFACDEHSELRTSAIHTFSNLMVHHGLIIGKSLWNRIFNELIFKFVDEVLEVYIFNTRSDNQAGVPVQRPGFGKNEAKEQMTKAAEEKAKTQKQWEDTLTILMQNLMKIIKKYVSIIEKMPDLQTQSPETLILKNILIKAKAFIMVSKNDLIAESIKFLHEMILTKPEILAPLLETIFDVLGIVRTFLIEARQDGKEIKVIMNKFIPEVLEILSEIFAPQRYAILNPNNVPYAKNLFEIIEKAIFYSKQAETFNSISQNSKLVVDSKTAYDFLEKIPTTLCENNEDMIRQYFQFLIRIMSLPATDKFTDQAIRKFITILDNVISSRVFDEAVYLPFLPAILDQLKNILCLRCDNEFLTLMVNTSKNSIPIWLYATDYFHNIVSQILGFFSLQASKDKVESSEDVGERLQKQKAITNQIIEIYEAVLKSAEKSFENISRGLLVEIKKSWFEMDMKFINAIGETLVPNFSVMDPEVLWKLIHILDFTYSFYSKNPIFTEQAGAYNASYGKDPAASSTISKITLEILFKISEGYQEVDVSHIKENEDIQKRVDLAKLATKKLIIKCKRILKLYIYDDQRSGTMPLPKIRHLEIVYILEKLKKLNIPLNSFQVIQLDELDVENKENPPNGNVGIRPDEDDEEPGTDSLAHLRSGVSRLEEIAQIRVSSPPGMDMKFLKGSKGHLIYLMPLFAEAITCREPELRELLKKIFLEVSKAIGVISF